MDNLTHSLTSLIIAKQFFPKKKLPRPFFFAAIIVANLPDIDLLLRLFGEDFYYYHHRGFTHSFIGLLVIMPLSFLITRHLANKDSKENQVIYTNGQVILFCFFQLLFAHFFLDYLTTYGTMLFYPLSYARFSAPLLFIIDPVLITLLIFIIFLLQFTRLKPYWGIVALTFYFSLAGGFKFYSKSLLPENLDTTQENMSSYSFPLPFAPLAWNLYNSDKQIIVSYLNAGKAKITHTNLWGRENQLCSGFSSSDFQEYLSFARPIRCGIFRPTLNKNTENKTQCHCHSLRYGPMPKKGEGNFASRIFKENGHSYFFSTYSREKITKLLETYY